MRCPMSFGTPPQSHFERALGALLPILIALAALGCAGSQTGSGESATNAMESGSEGSGSHAGGMQHGLVGRAAPDFSIPAVSGGGSLSISALSGKVVVLDFWATWCVPCRHSFPYYEGLAKRHPGEVAVLAVSVDDEPDGIGDFVKETGVTFPIGWDQDKSIVERYRPEAMPTSFLIDRNGLVRFVHGGFREGDESGLDGMVSDLLR